MFVATFILKHFLHESLICLTIEINVSEKKIYHIVWTGQTENAAIMQFAHADKNVFEMVWKNGLKWYICFASFLNLYTHFLNFIFFRRANLGLSRVDESPPIFNLKPQLGINVIYIS